MNLDERASAAIVVSREWADRRWADRHCRRARDERRDPCDAAHPVIIARILDHKDAQGLWIEVGTPSHLEDFAARTNALFIPWSEVLSITFDADLVTALGGPRPPLGLGGHEMPGRNAWSLRSTRRRSPIGRLSNALAPVLAALGLASGVLLQESSFDQSAAETRAVAPLREIASDEDDAYPPRALPHPHGPPLLMLMVAGLCLMKLGRLLRSEWSAVNDDTSAAPTTAHPADEARI